MDSALFFPDEVAVYSMEGGEDFFLNLTTDNSMTTIATIITLDDMEVGNMVFQCYMEIDNFHIKIGRAHV